MNLSELIDQAQLPSSIDVIVKLQKSIATGIASASDFASKLETDPGLSARVLRIANSAFYGKRSVESVEEAVVLIGENDLNALVISSEIISAFSAGEHKIDMQSFWHENIFAAVSAKIIARRLSRDKPRLFTASLLRRVGQLALYRATPTLTTDIIRLHKENPKQPMHFFEREILGYDHAEVSAKLLSHWDIPASVTMPINYYLYPNAEQNESPVDAAVIYLSHQHAQTKFEQPVPDWVSDEWLHTTLAFPPDALLAEAGEEIQVHYDRTVAMVLG